MLYHIQLTMLTCNNSNQSFVSLPARMELTETIEYSDQEILTKVIAGDGDAFAILYDRHASAAYRHILFRCSDEELAKDVVSQTFLHIWNHLRAGKPIQSFRAFVFQSARNTFIDLTRKKDFKNLSLETIVEENKEPADKTNLATESIINEEVRELKAALSTLPLIYQEILTLRYLDELDISEIAKVTGKKSSAIYVSLHRGVRLLRKALVEAEKTLHVQS